MFSSSRGLDSFDQYLQDVEKYPLIQDPQEERELARRARMGDKEAAERLVTANLRFVISYVKKYQGRGLGLAELVCIGNEGLLKAVKKFDPDKGVKFISYAVWWIRQTVLQALAEQTRSVRIPLNQNSNLARRARAGDKEAAERLVTANLRFVISYVKKYQGRGLGLAELVCIGNEGLLKAVKKFDPDKGVKFISYAVWWIRQTVLQALAEQTRSVRIPLNQNSNLAKLARTNTQLTQTLGRSPTDQEIADEMEEPVDTIRALRRVAASELSLDAPIDRGDRDSASFGERFAGAAAADIEEDVEAIARRDFLEGMFESYLTERERKILYLYYGLDDGEERTLEEIGSLLGVTRERIRQIRNRAFEKLRESPHGESLSGFWNAH